MTEIEKMLYRSHFREDRHTSPQGQINVVENNQKINITVNEKHLFAHCKPRVII